MKEIWKCKRVMMPGTIIKTATSTSAILGNHAKRFTQKNMTESVIESSANNMKDARKKNAKSKSNESGKGINGK